LNKMSPNERSSNVRRSLFPTSYAKKDKKKEKYVSFSPYARCLKIESHELTDEEKSNIWWQKSDYEDFARVGRIISKAMLEGGSEIWLKSKSQTSSKSETSNDSRINNGTKAKDDTMIESLSSLSTDSNPPLHHGFLSEQKSQEFYKMRDKWWHKFGHSRRGLEHIASNAEGRQRHLNGRSAIRSIMDEQRRQTMFLPKGYADVDKFRTVYLKETHWARILARAAAESDADAVQTNFNDSCRKPREYYIKQHFDSNSNYAVPSTDMDLPIFMKDTITPKHTTGKINLDSNTASQICFRKSQVISISSKLGEKKKNEMRENKKNEAKAKTKASSKSVQYEPSILLEEKKSDSDGFDDDATTSSTSSEDSGSSSLAKMAAGWGVNESQEDMSSVLIGMGISAKPNITVG